MHDHLLLGIRQRWAFGGGGDISHPLDRSQVVGTKDGPIELERLLGVSLEVQVRTDSCHSVLSSFRSDRSLPTRIRDSKIIDLGRSLVKDTKCSPLRPTSKRPERVVVATPVCRPGSSDSGVSLTVWRTQISLKRSTR